MLKDGTYSTWFKTALGEGTGIVHLAAGKLSGSDSILSYDGSYETAGDRFTAILRTRRHTAGHATVFGVDDLELKLEGTILGKTARCTGTADIAPGLIMEATLIPCQSQPAAAGPLPAPKRDASRLSRLPKPSRGR
jgi:hypothetical protein